MSYKITKEQIHRLVPTISSTGEDLLKNWFPEAFELPNGVWYKSNTGALIFKTGSNEGYGFSVDLKWLKPQDVFAFNELGRNVYKWQPASEEEVKAALIAEAKRRGFGMPGTKFKDAFGTWVDFSDIEGFDFWNLKSSFEVSDENKFNISVKSGDGGVIYHNGKWGEIIKPELPKSVTDWISQLGKDEAIRLINETQWE